jgi:DNA helicase IV
LVFIICLTNGYGGFPAIWLEYRIFLVINDLLMEDERRLFYLAIARAKEKLFLIT